MTTAIARALALAAVASGAALAVPGAASAEPGYDLPSGTPEDCFGRLQTVDAKNAYGQIFWRDGSITHEVDDGFFPFQPKSMTPYGAAGGEDDEHGNRQGISSSYAIDPDGRMHDITHRYGSDAQGNPVAEITNDEVIGAGWGATEDLARGEGLYRLTPGGRLVRSTMDEGKPTNPTSVFATGGVALRTIGVTRETTWKGEKADVLLTTTTDGRLREYIVQHKDPTKWTARNLTTSGWGDVSQISTSTCGGAKGRAITARHDNGRISVWYDRDATDFSAADITGGYTKLPALPDSTKTHQ